jgi:hypothetical protein
MSTTSKEELESILPYATEQQGKAIKARIKCNTVAEAAIECGLTDRTIRAYIAATKKKAANGGLVPGLGLAIHSPDSGMEMTGASIYRDGIWHKFKKEKDEEENEQKLVDTLVTALSNYKPLKKIPQPKKCDKDLLAIYPMGDPHLGMYAWSRETGRDFDCDIAEKGLRGAMTHLVDKAPNAETAIILNLGDFFHGDSNSNTTTKGTDVDVDGRWARVLEIGVCLMVDCVNLALTKHKKVIVKNNIGNHDTHTSQVLSICLRHAFKNNKRVEIAEPADKFFFYQFGDCMIGSTHGDMVKPNRIHGVVTNYQPKMWGDTIHRYFYFGHFHTEKRIEDNGLITEIFNTLASSDAWHNASGYRSKNNMKLLVLHKEHGEIERYIYSLAGVVS